MSGIGPHTKPLRPEAADRPDNKSLKPLQKDIYYVAKPKNGETYIIMHTHQMSGFEGRIVFSGSNWATIEAVQQVLNEEQKALGRTP